MALDLEDQEQLDEFKVWWDKYGKLTMNLVLFGLIAYASWQAYQYFQNKKFVEASDIYQTMVQIEPTKVELIKAEADKLIENYAATPYAGRAAVLLAKTQFAAEDVSGAKEQLEWAVANASENTTKALASIQLATLMLDEKDYAGAEKVLQADLDKGFVGLKDDLLGDVFAAQGKTAEAKKSYESALLHLDNEGRLRLFTQQKLDSLGS